MVFDFKLMFRLVYKSLVAGRGTNARLTVKRISVIIVLFTTYPVLETITWFCFLLDDIFFRAYRNVDVKQPIFIVGVPRSGTTFLHRLLAKDATRFTSMKLWELLFAPSIVQKKFFLALRRIDTMLGSPFARNMAAYENRFVDDFSKMHRYSLFEPEEDEALLLHNFSTFILVVVFPFEDDFTPFVEFDDSLHPGRRSRIMRFYKQCVQRHLFVFGKGRQYLSKNPIFTSKIRAISETFPDSGIICTTRHPFDVIPSQMNLTLTFCNSFMSPVEEYPMSDSLYDTIAHWYRHSIKEMQKLPSNRGIFIKYDRLTRDPGEAVTSVYDRFHIVLTPQFRRILDEASGKGRSYKSKHQYSLEQMGLDPDVVVSDLKDVFDFFGFRG